MSAFGSSVQDAIAPKSIWLMLLGANLSGAGTFFANSTHLGGELRVGLWVTLQKTWECLFRSPTRTRLALEEQGHPNLIVNWLSLRCWHVDTKPWRSSYSLRGEEQLLLNDFNDTVRIVVLLAGYIDCSKGELGEIVCNLKVRVGCVKSWKNHWKGGWWTVLLCR